MSEFSFSHKSIKCRTEFSLGSAQAVPDAPEPFDKPVTPMWNPDRRKHQQPVWSVRCWTFYQQDSETAIQKGGPDSASASVHWQADMGLC